MVHFVGAGCGAPDLITLRGRRLLEEADVIVYAGSLVNPALLGFAKKDCRIYNSAQMTLVEVIAVMEEAESRQQMTVRLHTGDPSLYGAIREQIDCLKEQKILCRIRIHFSVIKSVIFINFSGAAFVLRQDQTIRRNPGKSVHQMRFLRFHTPGNLQNPFICFALFFNLFKLCKPLQRC